MRGIEGAVTSVEIDVSRYNLENKFITTMDMHMNLRIYENSISVDFGQTLSILANLERTFHIKIYSTIQQLCIFLFQG